MAQPVGRPAPTHALATIDACTEAHKLCIQTSAYAAAEGGALAGTDVLQALHDAADVALATSNCIARASSFHKELAALAARVAHHAAHTLAPHTSGDGQLRAAHAALEGAARTCAELAGLREVAEYDAHDEAVEETFPGSDTVPPPTEL